MPVPGKYLPSTHTHSTRAAMAPSSTIAKASTDCDFNPPDLVIDRRRRSSATSPNDTVFMGHLTPPLSTGRRPAEVYPNAGLKGGFMRLRCTVLATALAALGPAAVPGPASAAPRHNRGLTIHAVPHQIIAGEAVLIFGHLKGPGHGNQVIRLYHRINPFPFFTLVGTTHTN